ncbi:MAG: hypothetical protein J6K52_03680 [Clostridia bacterium]|nr:hypothetical protein [Clostridia bacterium]
MKEIGGYFGLEQLIKNEYYKDLIALNSARNALVYILEARKIKKLYIPYFLCDSVAGALEKEGYKYEYYHIDKTFLPAFDKRLDKDEYLYIVNYYGQIDKERIIELKNRYGNIILDNVQAFFQEPILGIDTIYSLRKFFGVPDGAYLYCDASLDKEIPTDASMNRMKHILGRYEGESASLYYSDFKANDASFKEEPLKYMSPLTHNILGAIDYEGARKTREENYKHLEKELGKINKLDFKMPKGPYAYPFYCENGMEIKKRLAEKKIFVATLWPNVLNMNGTLEKDLAENILPLPVDQRYNDEDMHKVVLEVLSCLKN